MVPGGAVAEERGRRGGGRVAVAVVGAVDGGAVHAVEHEVDVGDAAGVPAHELEQAPDGEERAALHAGVVEVDVQPAASAGDGDAHGRAPPRRVEESARHASPRPAPRRQVPVDRREVGRALTPLFTRRRRRRRRRVGRPRWMRERWEAGDGRRAPQRGARRRPALGVRERVPWRRLQVVAQQRPRPRQRVVVRLRTHNGQKETNKPHTHTHPGRPPVTGTAASAATTRQRGKRILGKWGVRTEWTTARTMTAEEAAMAEMTSAERGGYRAARPPRPPAAPSAAMYVSLPACLRPRPPRIAGEKPRPQWTTLQGARAAPDFVDRCMCCVCSQLILSSPKNRARF